MCGRVRQRESDRGEREIKTTHTCLDGKTALVLSSVGVRNGIRRVTTTRPDPLV